MLNEVPIYGYEDVQKDYSVKVHDLYRKLKGKNFPKVFIKTFGCQQNVSDSEKYAGMFLKMGFDFTDNKNVADVIIFNTCAIRENAENKIFGHLGQIKNIKKNNPSLFVIVCGCMTEQDTIAQKIQSTYPFVNLIFGTHSIGKFPEIFYNALLNTKKSKVIHIKNKTDSITEDIPIKRNERFRAFVSIMYGCNNFCSYCIVPYVRGRERSREPEKIIQEFRNLLKAGYKDITLLGQNVNSYGKDLSCGVDFSDLLRLLDDFDGEYKIRFMTSHPKDAGDKLFKTIASSRHIAHHVHLPVQCGSNRVLDVMNRKYTKEHYLELISKARAIIPDLTLTSDIIVGFPDESEEEFQETLELIQKVKFSSLFTFIYSPREGTPAAKLPDFIAKEQKTKRILNLLEVQEKISEKICKDIIDKNELVLAEGYSQETSSLMCRTDSNIAVEVKGDKDLAGKFLQVRITDAKKGFLKGELI